MEQIRELYRIAINEDARATNMDNHYNIALSDYNAKWIAASTAKEKVDTLKVVRDILAERAANAWKAYDEARHIGTITN